MGAGVMGSGIAQVFASGGLNVTLVDRTDELLDTARGKVETGLAAMLEAGFWTEEQARLVRRNIVYTTAERLPQLAPNVDFALESASERHEVKQDVFAQLDRYCRPDCILASNTSSQNIFEYVTVSNPRRLMIVHWFNPPYLMRLVELVKGPETDDGAVAAVRELLESLGKRVCVLNQYVPGFIVNRIANAIFREAGSMIMDGLTTGADIDTAIRETSGVRYAFEGPLALYDMLGWDLILSGCRDVFPSLCNDSDTSALAEGLVASGRLGLKSGAGIYKYDGVDRDKFLAERTEKIVKMIKAADSL